MRVECERCADTQVAHDREAHAIDQRNARWEGSDVCRGGGGVHDWIDPVDSKRRHPSGEEGARCLVTAFSLENSGGLEHNVVVRHENLRQRPVDVRGRRSVAAIALVKMGDEGRCVDEDGHSA